MAIVIDQAQVKVKVIVWAVQLVLNLSKLFFGVGIMRVQHFQLIIR